ncbi:phage late control D family protein [Cetobacterium sp.]|uniref:phage late control D family protein n=1 Tax=Cetobacterium sp. TaxID=2071632 RepID=UPI003F3FF4BF
MGRIRQAYAEIKYNEKDISLDLEKYLSALTITDNFSGQLDDIDIRLRSKEMLFLKPGWALKKKARLDVALITENWENQLEEKIQLPCGSFFIDDRNFEAYSISVKGISAPIGNILDQKNSKHWENTTLKILGEEIAKKHKLKFQYLVNEEIKFGSLDQDKETDLSFLNRIAEDEGISVKITFNKIVLIDRDIIEKKEATRIINLLSQEISNDWNFRERTKDVYDKCQVTYLNLTSCLKETETYTADGKNTATNEEDEKVLKINKRSSSGDIKKLAMKKLKQANRGEVEFTFSIIGDLNITAGTPFKLINAGIFNGKYMIEKITRTLAPFRADVEAYLIELDKEGSENNSNS